VYARDERFGQERLDPDPFEPEPFQREPFGRERIAPGPPVPERSLGELFAELSQETSTLVRQELTLARKEVTQKVSLLGRDVAFVAVGGAIAYGGFLCLLATLVVVLYIILHHWWLSALIVTVLALGGGGLLIQQGLNNLKREDLTPRRTLQSLQQSGEWAKEQVQ
jgi:hypothetical protein